MDYETKPTSREDLRRYACILRRIFNVPQTGAFPVLEILDHIPDIFEDSNYIIVEDKDLPAKTMAQCTPNNAGGMTIEIKRSVYEGAYKYNIGAFRGFICHEICHIFLFSIGFTPIYTRSFDDGVLPAFRSVEWQAKALCGEVMIPYEESRGMKVKTVQEIYQVSEAFAKHRCKQDRSERRNAR